MMVIGPQVLSYCCLAVCNMAAPVYEDASLTMCVVLLPKAMEVTVN